MRVLWVVLALAAPGAASAETCAPRQVMVAALTGKYAEGRIIAGLTGAGTVVEMWANLDSGSWSLIETRPDGLSCIKGAGSAAALLLSVTPEGDPA